MGEDGNERHGVSGWVNVGVAGYEPEEFVVWGGVKEIGEGPDVGGGGLHKGARLSMMWGEYLQ